MVQKEERDVASGAGSAQHGRGNDRGRRVCVIGRVEDVCKAVHRHCQTTRDLILGGRPPVFALSAAARTLIYATHGKLQPIIPARNKNHSRLAVSAFPHEVAFKFVDPCEDVHGQLAGMSCRIGPGFGFNWDRFDWRLWNDALIQAREALDTIEKAASL
jgi:hypothetical protein